MNLKVNKTITIALILVLSTTMAVTTFIPTVESVDLDTYLLINASPNPVGVGQIAYVNVFLSKPPVNAGMMGSGDKYEDITINVVRPDGTKQTLGPFTSDVVGGIWSSITPTQVGTYTLQGFYPGDQTMSSYGTDYYYFGSETEIVELVVTEDPLPEFSNTPLPTEYWSRPIYSTNYGWAQLGGNWFGLAAPAFATTGQYDATGNLNSYSKAPNTGHILWTKPTAFGGQVGAPYNNDQESQYTSTSIIVRHFEPIIINGILYYTHYPSVSEIASWKAVDLRTGEELWTREAGLNGNEPLRMGQVLKFHSMQEFGSFPLLYSQVGGGMFNPSADYNIYDPMTGDNVATITNGAGTSFLMDFEGQNQGTLLAWITNSSSLTMWNSTKAMAGGGFGSLILRASGEIAWDDGYQWSVPRNFTVSGEDTGNLGIGSRTIEVILLRSAPTLARQVSAGYQFTVGIDAKTGAKLWGPLKQTIPEGRDVSLIAARDGYYVLYDKDLGEVYGYSLTNGQKLWGPIKLEGNAWSHIEIGGDIAYGKVYIWDFGGYVRAIDLETGNIEWTFHRGSSGYDTPYGVYPLWHFGTHSIADGKIFLSESSMYTPPLFPGAQRLAIDCETGELVWSILSFSGRSPGAIADGMLVQWNSYDNQIYTFGKGQSATTISIQNDVITEGDSILIKGKVTDESPGTKNSDRVARFPDGVPAIADEYMSPWMEYVYMQQPKPTDANGVEVVLSVLDPNNNVYEIGTTTSDVNGMYKLKFVPPVAGEYTVIATFEGSESYFISSGQTALLVEEAPQPTAPPEVTPGPMTDTYLTGSTIAILAGIAIAVFLLLRKK